MSGFHDIEPKRRPGRDPQRPPLDPMALTRQAIEEYGVSPTAQLVSDIMHLADVPNSALQDCVLRQMTALEAAKQAGEFSQHVPPPDAFDSEDGILLAVTDTPSGSVTPVRMMTRRMPSHTLVAGGLGSGKSHLIRIMLSQLEQRRPDVPIIVFDPNRTYETFCADPSRWLSIDWEDLRLNPLAPPTGYPSDRWLNEGVDIFSRGELMHSKYLLAGQLQRLMQHAERRAAATGRYLAPNLFDLHEALRSLWCRPASPDERYRQSLLNVLGGRLRATGSVFHCASGMEERLTHTRARISTEGLAPLETLEFVQNHLTHYLYARRMLAPRVDPPDLAALVVLEEAQTFLQSRTSDAIPYYQEVLLRARNIGLGFVLVVQDMGRIDPTLGAACSNFFLFAQPSAANKRAAASLLDLSARETEMLSRLPTGDCFIRFTAGHDGWPYPFRARILP